MVLLGARAFGHALRSLRALNFSAHYEIRLDDETEEARRATIPRKPVPSVRRATPIRANRHDDFHPVPPIEKKVSPPARDKL